MHGLRLNLVAVIERWLLYREKNEWEFSHFGPELGSHINEVAACLVECITTLH